MRKSKRIFIICMIGAVFFLSGCSERKEKQVEITVMHGWGSTEMDHKEMQKIYSDFQKKYAACCQHQGDKHELTQRIHDPNPTIPIGHALRIIYSCCILSTFILLRQSIQISF